MNPDSLLPEAEFLTTKFQKAEMSEKCPPFPKQPLGSTRLGPEEKEVLALRPPDLRGISLNTQLDYKYLTGRLGPSSAQLSHIADTNVC